VCDAEHREKGSGYVSDAWLRDQRSMKTDGIYRYRLENPPPRRAEKWWDDGVRFGVRLGSGVLTAILVSELRRWGSDAWLWGSLILIAIVLVNLLVDSMRARWRPRR
jgi:hypothetical protein